MSINLQKGQRQALSTQQFSAGLGWDENPTPGQDFDLDASVFILGENKKMLSEKHFVYYNNLADPEGAVTHSGDNLTGDGDGDDETIMIDLSKIHANAHEIIIVVTIHEAEARGQNFGQVRNSYIRIVDGSNSELMKYELDEDYSIERAVEFGRIYKRGAEWKFEAVGVGAKGGLQEFVTKFK